MMTSAIMATIAHLAGFFPAQENNANDFRICPNEFDLIKTSAIRHPQRVKTSPENKCRVIVLGSVNSGVKWKKPKVSGTRKRAASVNHIIA